MKPWGWRGRRVGVGVGWVGGESGWRSVLVSWGREREWVVLMMDGGVVRFSIPYAAACGCVTITITIIAGEQGNCDESKKYGA